MSSLIAYVGSYSIDLRTDYFASLVKSIISQQLSAKAASSIWTKVLKICPLITPEALYVVGTDALKGVGISSAKLKYLENLTSRVATGELNLNTINTLTDEEVIYSLTQVKGIGRWTAEMFLIFSLGREDIFAFDDVGLQRAVKWLYMLDDVSPDKLKVLSEEWKPYRTAASLYLWEVINQDFIKRSPNDVLIF